MSGAVAEGRLHPLAAAVYGYRTVRNAGPLLLAAWVTDVPHALLIAAVAAVVLVAAPLGLLAWWRFRYRVAGGRLTVDHGVLVRRNRVVPLERIRGVSFDEPPLHRVFGLVRARVEAAAAGERGGELSLAAVSRAQAGALREAVMRGGDTTPDGEAVPADPPPLAALRPGRLALAGATSGRFVVVPAAAAAGLLNFADDLGLDGLLRSGAGQVADRAPHSAAGIALATAAAVVAVLGLAALGSVIADWAFQLRVDTRRLATVRGLLSRRRTAVDRRRVLAVEVCDSPVRRALGMAAVDAAVGGFSVKGDGESAGRVRLLPLGDAGVVGHVVDHLAPGGEVPLNAHPGTGLVRRLGRAVALPLAAGAGALIAGERWPAAAALAAALLMVPVAVDRHRNLGHGLGRWLVLRSGSLARRRSLIDPATPVAYAVRSSPFQRRRGLCTMQVHLGLGAGTRSALDLGEDQAQALMTALQPWARSPSAGPTPAGPPG